MKMRTIAVTAALALTVAAARSEGAPAVVFVCEHGSVKSVIAAELFNRRAAERKLSFRAVARGVTPDAAVPAGVAENLRADGFDVAPFKPAAIVATEIETAKKVVSIGAESPLLAKANVTRWAEIPPASTQYAKSRDAMRARMDALLDELASGDEAADCH